MLFGNKLNFGIQFELDEDYGGIWLFGKVCYWIKGQMVGDFELGCSLRDVLFQWERFVCDKGKRDGGVLFSEDDKSFIEMMKKGMIDQDGYYYSIAVNEEWARFDICPTVDVFWDWVVYLVENENKCRCVASKLNENIILSVLLDRMEVDEIIESATNYLLNLHQIEDKS